MNDARELRYLQRLLAARDYERNQRPAVLAQIAKLKSLLVQDNVIGTKEPEECKNALAGNKGA